MTGITFDVELVDSEMRAQLSALVERMSRPIGFYRNVGEYLTQIAVPRNFASQSAPDGTPWAKLSPVTIERRKAMGKGSSPILQVTRRLAASIISHADDQGVDVGSPVPYAAVMHGGAAQGAFGAHIGRTKPSEKRPWSQDYFAHLPWGNIPARPYLGLSTADEIEILAIASDWLTVEGSP